MTLEEKFAMFPIRETLALQLHDEGKSLDEITKILVAKGLVASNLRSPKERTRQIIEKAAIKRAKKQS